MAAYIPLILFTVLTNFGSQIMLKHGMTSMENFDIASNGIVRSALDVAFNPFVIGGLVVMAISMGAHLVVLSKVDISYAYPFLGLSFVLTAAWGYFMLGENVNTFRIIGVLLICSGVALVAKS